MHDIKWHCHTKVEKYEGDPTLHERESGLVVPFDVDEREGNLLVIGGVSALWQFLIGNPAALTAFNNANAHLGVGNSSTAAADTQTDLQGVVAGVDKFRKAMDATYPQHTDSTGAAGSKSLTLRSTFGTADANITWAEWGVFNASSAGRMLNRKVEALGTKTNTATWVLTVTLSLA